MDKDCLEICHEISKLEKKSDDIKVGKKFDIFIIVYCLHNFVIITLRDY